MIRLVAIAILLTSCRISLDDDTAEVARQCTVSTTSQSCMDAVSHSDLAWIEDKIFNASCNFSGCHKSANDEGGLDLSLGHSHDALVGVSSLLESSRKLVVPNDVEASYLMLMLGSVTPANASPPGEAPSGGYMPKGNSTLCCQKLEAIERWINAGAPK